MSFPPPIPRHVAPLLAYADIPARYGVVFDKSADSLTISIPRLRFGHRHRRTLLQIFGSLFAVSLLVVVVGMAFNKTVLAAALAYPLGLVSFVMLLAVLVPPTLFTGRAPEAWRFEMNRRTLRIFNWNNSDHFEREYPFALLGAIRCDLYAMGVTIQIIGKDLVETLHHYPDDLKKWTAETLRDAHADLLKSDLG